MSNEQNTGGFVIEEDDSLEDLDEGYSKKKKKKAAEEKKAEEKKAEEPAPQNAGLARIEEKFKNALPAGGEEIEEKKIDIRKLEEEAKAEKVKEESGEAAAPAEEREPTTAELYPQAQKNESEIVYALRTTANREDQVMDFVSSNAQKKKFGVRSVIRPHGMRGYIFIEAESRFEAEQAAYNIPYARGILPKVVYYSEIEHMLEQVKRDVNIQKNDIVEIISGPFKREKAKISRIDKTKEEVVVELLEAAVPIPITLKLDTVKVIRRDDGTGNIEE